MQKSLTLYQDLKEAFDYLCTSWFKYHPTASTIDDANVILASSAFLFDNLYAKEDAGREITAAAAKDLGASFRPRALSEMATKIRLGMSAEDISRGGTTLRDYVKWVAEEHPVILDALKDNHGLLVLATAEELTNLINNENKEHLVPLEVAELTMLSVAQAYFLCCKEFFGMSFLRNPSAAFFLDVESEMERINKEITD